MKEKNSTSRMKNNETSIIQTEAYSSFFFNALKRFEKYHLLLQY